MSFLQGADRGVEREQATLTGKIRPMRARAANGAKAERLDGGGIDLAVAVARDQHLARLVLRPDEWRQKMLPMPHRHDDRHLLNNPLDGVRRFDAQSRRLPDKTQVI